jgi:putative FmdB family regulatory protein
LTAVKIPLKKEVIMPTYEYECKSCGHTFEIFQAMSDDPLKSCPECGREVRRLIFGGTGVIFKGSGFYVTDKGKAASAPAKAANTASTGGSKGGGGSEQSPAASSATASAASGESAPKKTGAGEKAKTEAKTA